MGSATTLGWGVGWPNCVTDEIVTAIVGTNKQLRIPVRKQLVPLLAGLVLDLETSRNRLFRQDWCWGFACRPISGTRRASNHSQGCAPDLDAPENPYMSEAMHASPHPLRKRIAGRYLRTTMPDDVVEISRRWGWYWGGLYASKPDPMHFDVDVSPEQAARLIADLRDLDDRPTPIPVSTYSQEDVMLTTIPNGGELAIPLPANKAFRLTMFSDAHGRGGRLPGTPVRAYVQNAAGNWFPMHPANPKDPGMTWVPMGVLWAWDLAASDRAVALSRRSESGHVLDLSVALYPR